MDIALPVPATGDSPRNIPSWLLLFGAAGMVNGFEFLVYHEFVTHMISTITLVGCPCSSGVALMKSVLEV